MHARRKLLSLRRNIRKNITELDSKLSSNGNLLTYKNKLKLDMMKTFSKYFEWNYIINSNNTTTICKK